MEPSESTTPDPATKSRSRVLSRITIWLAVFVIGAGGLIVWDRHDYPIPYAIDPTNPFFHDTSRLPDFLDSPRRAIGEFQWKLQTARKKRILRKKLKRLIIAGSAWISTEEVAYAGEYFKNVEMHFKPDGSLTSIFRKNGTQSHSIFEFDRYERTAIDTLVLSNKTNSEALLIGIDIGHTEKDEIFIYTETPLLFIKLNPLSP